MIINQSQLSQSRELVYDFDGSVRVFARAGADIDEGKLTKVVHAPFGWSVLPFTTEVEAFYVGVSRKSIPFGLIGWVYIAGKSPNILLSTDARGKSIVEVVDGRIHYSDSQFMTARGFAYIESVDEKGRGELNLVPREIINELGSAHQ
jgi:hypothetical protein